MTKGRMPNEWFKVRSAVEFYVDISERKFRDFLKDGMRHVRLPSGTILIKRSWIDEYFCQFEVVNSRRDEIQKIADEMCKDLN